MKRGRAHRTQRKDAVNLQEPTARVPRQLNNSLMDIRSYFAAMSRNSAAGFDSPTSSCLHRIQRDIMSLRQEPLEGIFVVTDETKNNVCHAVIIGPSDTPYENGIFQFLLEFPDDYPNLPPKVILLTTEGGTVRFRLNVMACGTVCLSILGTWIGPGWSAVMTIGSVMMSIQSMMNSKPYLNEPGLETMPSKEVLQYNQYARYQTIKTAVVGAVHGTTRQPRSLHPDVVAYVQAHFLENTEAYKYICDEYSFLDGRRYYDKDSSRWCTFAFQYLRGEIEYLEKGFRPLHDEEKVHIIP
jgi:ubiquitin-conjugating enzyme E2 Z